MIVSTTRLHCQAQDCQKDADIWEEGQNRGVNGRFAQGYSYQYIRPFCRQHQKIIWELRTQAFVDGEWGPPRIRAVFQHGELWRRHDEIIDRSFDSLYPGMRAWLKGDVHGMRMWLESRTISVGADRSAWYR